MNVFPYITLVHIFMPIMLQKPSAKSKARDHSKYLAQRLEKWTKGDRVGLRGQGGGPKGSDGQNVFFDCF